MPRICTICSHAQRSAIEAALVTGTPNRVIARQFDVGHDAVRRHASEHVGQQIAQHKEAREEAQALDVVKQLGTINHYALAAMSEARTANKPELMLKAMDRVQRQIELQAKLLGQLSDAPVVNILLLPEWLTFRSALLAALVPHPQARIDVAAALMAIERQQEGGGNHGHLN